VTSEEDQVTFEEDQVTLSNQLKFVSVRDLSGFVGICRDLSGSVGICRDFRRESRDNGASGICRVDLSGSGGSVGILGGQPIT